MANTYFYDIPVYRLPSDAYYAARDKYVEKVVFQVGTSREEVLRKQEELNPRVNDRFRSHLERRYGGCWEFNEIIGYIRLHFLGSQVRGEYFSASKQRVVKTRRKTFEFQTWKLAPEVDIEYPYGTEEVLFAIRQYVDDCKDELPRRFVDTSLFDSLAPYVDWGAFFR